MDTDITVREGISITMRGNVPGGPIHWKLYLPVAPSSVYDALNTAAGRASFWAESANEKDGEIEFRFINGLTYRSKILERDFPRLWVIDYFGSMVRFHLSPDEGSGTELLLINEGVEFKHWNEVHAGWLNVLFPLKAWLTHGVDLRNHDPSRTWDQGYVDQ